MKIRVNPHKCEIIKTPVNEKEINITKVEFEFADEITNNYVKEAIFTYNGNSYKQTIINNECDIPSEVLVKKGQVEIGVVAYIVENNVEIKRYNPSPAYFDTWLGSLKEAENSEPITPTDKEQIMQMLTNINLTVNKEGKITTISFTNTDGTTQTETLEDGMGLDYNWVGTSLGVKREDETQYVYVNLKGEKGDAGSVHMIVVQQLPTENIDDDAIYLVPLENPTEQGNNYAEYVYINNNWELLGKIGVQVDLTDYALKSELPTALSELTDDTTHRLVTDTEKTTWSGKADLNDIPDVSNFITKDVNNLTNYYDKTTIDNLIGDINSALDVINGETV